tara:strand:- start:77 stop:325 length:249 start_codon:yes stop_codon:yes gene_type:complete
MNPETLGGLGSSSLSRDLTNVRFVALIECGSEPEKFPMQTCHKQLRNNRACTYRKPLRERLRSQKQSARLRHDGINDRAGLN